MSTAPSTASRSKKTRSRKWEVIDVPAIDELELLTEDEIADTSLTGGFCIRFFRHDMQCLYTVASEYVKLTRGVVDYLHDYNQLGPNKSRNKLFLCTQFDKEKKCVNGSLCREVHCTLSVEDVQDAQKYHVPSNATGAPNVATVVPGAEIILKGLNQSAPPPQPTNTAVVAPTQLSTEAGAVTEVPSTLPPPPSGSSGPITLAFDDSSPLDTQAISLNLSDSTTVIYLPENLILRHSLHSRWTSRTMYPTLPSGITFRVALPNTPTPVDAYDSSELFVTKGAQEFYDQAVQEKPITVTMQHCAHYSKNGICCFGDDCQFVHVLHYKSRDRIGDVDASGSDVESSVCGSSGPSESGRRKGRRGGSAKETPLSLASSARGRGESAASSRSASANPGTPKAVASPATANPIYVPPTWTTSTVPSPPVPTTAHGGGGGAGQPSLPPPQFPAPPSLPQMYGAKAPMGYPTGPAAPPPVIMMQGPNGEMFFVAQAPPPMGLQPQVPGQQPFYVMPMPTFQP